MLWSIAVLPLNNKVSRNSLSEEKRMEAKASIIKVKNK
jgi:hypothetical protein